MASSVTIRRYLLVILIVCTVIFSSASGEGDDYEPEVGPIDKPGEGHEGGGEGENEGQEGGGEEGEGHEIGGEDHGHEGGEGGPIGGADHDNNPTHIVDGALLCFHEKHIYNHCEESCRLTVNGELHVPPDQVDEFCNGPCIDETNLVLDCLDGIMEHFIFFNKATTQDVRDTILAGCGHGDHRGDFDVEEHIEADEGSGKFRCHLTVTLLFGIVITIIGQIFLL